MRSPQEEPNYPLLLRVMYVLVSLCHIIIIKYYGKSVGFSLTSIKFMTIFGFLQLIRTCITLQHVQSGASQLSQSVLE